MQCIARQTPHLSYYGCNIVMMTELEGIGRVAVGFTTTLAAFDIQDQKEGAIVP